MTGFFRVAMASPRKQLRDRKTGRYIDLAYVTPQLIVTSMPADDVLHKLYRTNVRDLREFLDSYHRDHWQIWNFRAEKQGGYQDQAFYGRVVHFPFPDHQAPPFGLITKFVESIDGYLNSDARNVAVLHCKAGQGRSGTMACAYLIAAKHYSWNQAVDRFTTRRMRIWYGPGVNINSQLRYLKYTQQWMHMNQEYHFMEKALEIDSITLFNARYTDITVKCGEYDSGTTPRFNHTFSPGEQQEVKDAEQLNLIYTFNGTPVRFNPDIVLSINRSKLVLGTWSFVHSLAHAWFNVFFETVKRPFDTSQPPNGFIILDWEQCDGLLGTNGRGLKLFDKLEVKWHFLRNFELKNPLEFSSDDEQEEIEEEDSDGFSQQDHSESLAFVDDLTPTDEGFEPLGSPPPLPDRMTESE